MLEKSKDEIQIEFVRRARGRIIAQSPGAQNRSRLVPYVDRVFTGVQGIMFSFALSAAKAGKIPESKIGYC